MNGKLVQIDGHNIWVCCVSTAPLSVVLTLAAEQMRIKEELARHNSPEAKAYRAARERAVISD